MSANETAEAILLVIKRLAKWGLFLLGGLVVIGFMIAGIVWCYEKWDRRPQIVKTLKGIGIGEKINDVLFKNGDLVAEPKGDAANLAEQELKYKGDEMRIAITARNGLVKDIQYFCKDTDFSDVNGIACDATGEIIFERFPGLVRVLCKKDANEEGKKLRVYDVVEFGTRYGLRGNRVQMFFVTDKPLLESYVGKSWVPCE